MAGLTALAKIRKAARAVSGASRLFAIDNPDEFARAHRIVHDAERTGLADHVHDVHWSLADREQNPRSQYVSSTFRARRKSLSS